MSADAASNRKGLVAGARKFRTGNVTVPLDEDASQRIENSLVVRNPAG